MVIFQQSFYDHLKDNKNCEKFFKVLYDRMCDALQEIKATVSVNTGDQLTSGKNKDTPTGEENRKKCKLHMI